MDQTIGSIEEKITQNFHTKISDTKRATLHQLRAFACPLSSDASNIIASSQVKVLLKVRAEQTVLVTQFESWQHLHSGATLVL